MAHLPEDVTFRTKPQIAAQLVRNLAVLGQVELTGSSAIRKYGRTGHLLDELELLEQKYVLEVPKTWVFWTADPAAQHPAVRRAGSQAECPHAGRGTHRSRDRQRTARLGVEGAAGPGGSGGAAGVLNPSAFVQTGGSRGGFVTRSPPAGRASPVNAGTARDSYRIGRRRPAYPLKGVGYPAGPKPVRVQSSDFER